MPRDILTTVMQKSRSERLLEDEQVRFREMIRAVTDCDVVVPLHDRWKRRETCCFCAGVHVELILKYIETDGRIGEHLEISSCRHCAAALKLIERERLCSFNGICFVVWI